jgi:hypothetical protein
VLPYISGKRKFCLVCLNPTFLILCIDLEGKKFNHNPEMYATMYLHLSYLSLQNFTLLNLNHVIGP